MPGANKNKAVFIVVYVLFLSLLAEGACRLYFSLDKTRVPFFEPRKIIYLFYPELKIVGRKETGTFDILLLGSSVLNKRWGDIENILYRELSQRRKIKIYNLSAPSHSSLDSYYKYKFLQDRKFDLVILYEGINEARANNCPASFFKDDYSHYFWYRFLNAYNWHKETRYVLLPYVVHYLLLKEAEHSGILPVVPKHRPKKEWLGYGVNIKTPFSFRRNLENILKIAKKNNEKVLLMTFAFYIPEDYTLKGFINRTLDYGYRGRPCPVELWGRPENVKAAILAHNAIVRDLARLYSGNVIFVDQFYNIPKEGKYFDDVCHLSREGCKKFTDNIKDVFITQAKEGVKEDEAGYN